MACIAPTRECGASANPLNEECEISDQTQQTQTHTHTPLLVFIAAVSLSFSMCLLCNNNK